MSRIGKLAWIEIQGNRILLTKSYGKDKYYTPGGKREPGEADEQALLREI
jgi:8-oxo-dGTP diphosphatase